MRKTEPQDARLATLPAQEQVRADVERRADRQRLVDRLDAGGHGVGRRAKVDRFSVDPDLAAVGDDGPAEALDERRLAGAVVADDAQHLARVELEVGVVESDDASVRLAQADGLEDGGGDRLGHDGGHALTLRIHWSTVTATMTRTPMVKSCQSGSKPARLRPLRAMPTMMAPSRVPDDHAAPAEQAGAADDDGRDGVEVGAQAGLWAGGADAAHEEPGTDRVDEASHGIHRHEHPIDLDAREAGGFRVVSGGVDVATPRGVAQDVAHDHVHREHAQRGRAGWACR